MTNNSIDKQTADVLTNIVLPELGFGAIGGLGYGIADAAMTARKGQPTRQLVQSILRHGAAGTASGMAILMAKALRARREDRAKQSAPSLGPWNPLSPANVGVGTAMVTTGTLANEIRNWGDEYEPADRRAYASNAFGYGLYGTIGGAVRAALSGESLLERVKDTGKTGLMSAAISVPATFTVDRIRQGIAARRQGVANGQ